MENHRIRHKLVLLMVMLCLLITTAGCGSGDEQALPAMDMLPKVSVPEHTDVDVYWDATYSMQGFTTVPQDNFYRTLPDQLSDIGSSMGTVTFYRFGESVQQLEGRQHRDFANPATYNEVTTAIHNVIDTSSTDHLTIIVTDLFESNADWSNVAQKIKEKYFAKHQAVAVIGIRNPFKGDIFDVGLDAAKFTYDSGSNPAAYRPFYLVVMGSEGQVTDFIKRWKSRTSGGPEMHYLVLSENLLQDTPTLATMETTETENLYPDSTVKQQDKRVKEYGIDSKTKPVSLSAAFTYKQDTDRCVLDLSKVKFYGQVMTATDGQWQPASMDVDLNGSIEKDPDKDNGYIMHMKFTPEASLTRGSWNLVTASIVPAQDGITLPKWVADWNMDGAQITQGNMDGSKTANIRRLLESLKDASMEAAHPMISSMTIVINYR